MTEILAAVTLGPAVTAIGAALVVVIGIALAFKSTGLGKRAIKHA